MSKDGIYQVLDWTDVRFTQLLIFFGSVSIFLMYAIALTYYGVAFSSLLLYVSYVSTQIPFGLLATHYYHLLGMRTKSRLKLIDPAAVDPSWILSNQEMRLEEISQVLDEIGDALQKLNPSVDDIIDLTWFAVIAWGAISTTVLAVFNPPSLFLASPALVLAGLCCATFYNGYRIIPTQAFDENFEHLKHLVLSRLSALQTVVGKRYFQPGISLFSKGKKKIINDFFAQMLSKSRDKGPVLTYWTGISSSDTERIDFYVEDELVKTIQDSLKHHPIAFDFGWILSASHDTNDPKVVLANEKSELRIDVQSTLVHSPTWVKNSSDELADALRVVLHELES
ncbi:MAG: hypothetical protein ACFFER_07575 [Candidatus Thorarchaeota archaeon]